MKTHKNKTVLSPSSPLTTLDPERGDETAADTEHRGVHVKKPGKIGSHSMVSLHSAWEHEPTPPTPATTYVTTTVTSSAIAVPPISSFILHSSPTTPAVPAPPSPTSASTSLPKFMKPQVPSPDARDNHGKGRSSRDAPRLRVTYTTSASSALFEGRRAPRKDAAEFFTRSISPSTYDEKGRLLRTPLTLSQFASQERAQQEFIHRNAPPPPSPMTGPGPFPLLPPQSQSLMSPPSTPMRVALCKNRSLSSSATNLGLSVIIANAGSAATPPSATSASKPPPRPPFSVADSGIGVVTDSPEHRQHGDILTVNTVTVKVRESEGKSETGGEGSTDTDELKETVGKEIGGGDDEKKDKNNEEEAEEEEKSEKSEEESEFAGEIGLNPNVFGLDKEVGEEAEIVNAEALVEQIKARAMPAVRALAGLIHSQASVLFITGAGASVASGIPTFRRGSDGIWNNYIYSWGTRSKFLRDPAAWWNDFWFRTHEEDPFRDTRPCAAHYAITEIMRRYPKTYLVTQNVDRLHLISGSDPARTIEVHGALGVYRCTNSACQYAAEKYFTAAQVRFERDAKGAYVPPRCSKCSSYIMPLTLLFDELYSSHSFFKKELVQDWLDIADAIVFVGTSFSVNLTLEALRTGVMWESQMFNFNIEPLSSDIAAPVQNVTGPSEILLPLLEEQIAALENENNPSSDNASSVSASSASSISLLQSSSSFSQQRIDEFFDPYTSTPKDGNSGNDDSLVGKYCTIQ